jgi:hypothetical protein
MFLRVDGSATPIGFSAKGILLSELQIKGVSLTPEKVYFLSANDWPSASAL